MIESSINTENKILKINIEDSWSAYDFIDLLTSLNILFQTFTELDSYEEFGKIRPGKTFFEGLLKDGNFGSSINNLQAFDNQLFMQLNFPSIMENSRLILDLSQDYSKDLLMQERSKLLSFEIVKIQFASPGFIDLLGLGKIVNEIFTLIKYYIPNKEAKLRNQLIEQDIIAKKIQNLESIGVPKNQLIKLLSIRDNAILNLKNLKLSGKLKSIELRKPDTPGN